MSQQDAEACRKQDAAPTCYCRRRAHERGSIQQCGYALSWSYYKTRLAALEAAAKGLAEAARRVVAVADVKLVPAHDDLPDYYTPSGALVDGALIHALNRTLAAYDAAAAQGEIRG